MWGDYCTPKTVGKGMTMLEGLYGKACCRTVRLTALLTLAAMLVCLLTPICAEGETAYDVYNGIDSAAYLIGNLAYSDIENTQSEAAIFKSGALGILKGYGSMLFAPGSYLTREQALAVVYRMAGKEEEALKEGERLNLLRRERDRKDSAAAVWSDGYMQLAANDRLITYGQLEDALQEDQNSLGEDDFRKLQPVTRQEFAYWIARTLQMEPVYGQEAIFNSYNDWHIADTEKIPWIEAVLRQDIINDDGSGYFRPDGYVTREQAAVIANNALDIIMSLRGMKRQFGTITGITAEKKTGLPDGMVQKTCHIRNSDGSADILISITYEPYRLNEHDPSLLEEGTKEIAVLRDGVLSDSRILKEGDRIEFTADISNQVLYAYVLSSSLDTRYVAARLTNMDAPNRLIYVREYFNLEFPKIRPGDRFSFDMPDGNSEYVYSYSDDVICRNEGKSVSPSDLKPGTSLILTLENNVAVKMEKAAVPFAPTPNNTVGGIVEDNNPSLGYVTLYNEDGTGISAQGLREMILFRTFSYPPEGNIEVLRNHTPALPEDIMCGDTIFIRLDSEGFIESISAVDNYIIKNGRIISKNADTLLIRFDDGIEQILRIDDDTDVISSGRIADTGSIMEGDSAAFTLNVTPAGTSLVRIAIENTGELVTGFYKGILAGIDNHTRSILFYDIRSLKSGNWIRTAHKGVGTVSISQDCSFYSGSGNLRWEDISLLHTKKNIYVAVSESYGGEEKAKVVSFKPDGSTESIYDDEILSVSGSGGIRLSAFYPQIGCMEGTIIVNEGRLTGYGSLDAGTRAYLVSNRDPVTGKHNASIISVEHTTVTGDLEIYRGRILDIEENSSFTLESFSRLEGLSWEFFNTPRTFNIAGGTRMIDENGVVSIREFKGYGEGSSIDKTVYVVAGGTEARLLSTAPYGSYLTRGGLNGVSDEKLALGNARNYKEDEFMWEESGDIEISILPNTVIIKQGMVIDMEGLENGDRLTVIRRDSISTDAYIVIVGEER